MKHTKIWMVHGLTSGQSLCMVVLEQLVEKVDRLGAHQMLILAVCESFPSLLRMSFCKQTKANIWISFFIYKFSHFSNRLWWCLPAKDVVESRIQLDMILLNILEELIGAKHFHNPHELKRESDETDARDRRWDFYWQLATLKLLLLLLFSLLDHSYRGRERRAPCGRWDWQACSRDSTCRASSRNTDSRRAARVPWSSVTPRARCTPGPGGRTRQDPSRWDAAGHKFNVAKRLYNIHSSIRFAEKCAYFSCLVIDHDIVRLDVAVHDAHAVAIVKALEQLEQIVADVVVGERLVQLLAVQVRVRAAVSRSNLRKRSVKTRKRVRTLKSVLLTYSMMSAGVLD